MTRILTADQLRAMSLDELKVFAQEMGIGLAGLEDEKSALYTKIVQHAIIED